MRKILLSEMFSAITFVTVLEKMFKIVSFFHIKIDLIDIRTHRKKCLDTKNNGQNTILYEIFTSFNLNCVQSFRLKKLKKSDFAFTIF